MSYRKEQIMSLAGVNTLASDKNELVIAFQKMLKAGMHGICFSPYEEGQEPGMQLTEAQVRRRIEILKPHTKWIRSFSCTEGNELIPRIAKEYGIKTLVGAWLGTDEAKNEAEIEGLLQLARDGFVDVAAVGNEVLYRGDLAKDTLLTHIKAVKQQIPNVPVGYVDAYYEFEDHADLSDICDVILANCYPFWEGCSQEYSLLYMKDMYRRAKKAGKGKPVIITETGWPSAGETLHGAQPSEENALAYFIDTQNWSMQEDIDIFYFSSFDESWKVGDEGDVGAYWGLWDKNEKLKY